MSDQTNKIEKLLDDFEEQREALKKYIQEIEQLKGNIGQVFSKNQRDYRNYMLFEQKLRTATEFYKTMLEMRKEITKTLKDESELRNKLLSGGEDLEDQIDVAYLADKLQSFQKKSEKHKEVAAEKYQEMSK